MSAPAADVLTLEERSRITRRLVAGLSGAGLLLVGLGLGWLRPDQAQLAELLKALAALVVGAPVILRGLKGLVRVDPSDVVDQLVALAVLAAMATGDFVTATLVPLLLEVGRLFEERTALGAQAAIDGIRRLRAPRATRLDEQGGESEVDPDSLSAGELVLVRPGEVIPVDGTVASGESSVDQAPITGESRYEEVGPGHEVFAGTLNLDGLLRITVSQAGEGTVLGRVVELLREVEASRTPLIRVLERYSVAYLPLVLAAAATTLFFTEDIGRAIAVLVVACPTALVLAAPAAMVAAMSAATRMQVLIKGAAFLEQMAEVDVVVLDKTGTVTEGSLAVESLHPAEGHSDQELLAAAAQVGAGSLHPISRAVVSAARERGLEVPSATEAQEERGRGVRVGELRLGRQSWLQESGVQGPFAQQESTGAWVARGSELLGFVSLSDRLREGAIEAVEALRELGVERLVLLTGDRSAVAHEVAAQLGISEVVAEVLPEEKLALVRAEAEKGQVVMMVGDGVNDALALSAAPVGVAIGAQVNEVALGGADIALLGSEIERLPRTVELALRTRRVMAGNAAIALGFAAVMVVLASVGVVGALAGALLTNLGALLVVANSARLLRSPGEASPLPGSELVTTG